MKHLASWTEEGTLDETIQLYSSIALSHAHEGGQEGRKIAGLIRSGSFLALCEYELPYGTQSVAEIANCRQALAFFQKAEFLPLGIDRQARAYKKFDDAEVVCKEVNETFRAARSGHFCFGRDYDAVLHRARRKIAAVLGPVPKLDELKYRFGPGATTLTKKRDASTVEKLQARLSCSENLLPHIGMILAEVPALTALHAKASTDEAWTVDILITEGVAEAVRKNAKIDRIIIKEPPLNTLVQLAVGDLMTRKLMVFGINLRNQSTNRELALIGSLTGHYATLDLSSASDTISIELVYELLPWDWAYFLDTLRSKTIKVRGKSVLLEKFSSMGNGFTFPLESLIFWALASSSSESDFASVYGDDIIVKSEDVARVMDTLHRSGFTVNKEKSFWEGSFRESCGGDYYSGIDVRPKYTKKMVSAAELFRLHNHYVRSGDLDRANVCLANIHPDLQIYGPDGYGDGHLLSQERLQKRHKMAASRGFGGFIFDTFSLKGRRDYRKGRRGDRVLPVYTIYTSEGEDYVLPTRGTERPELFALKKRIGRFRMASEPLPDHKPKNAEEGEPPVKAVPLPGTKGYRKISIYTLTRE